MNLINAYLLLHLHRTYLCLLRMYFIWYEKKNANTGQSEHLMIIIYEYNLYYQKIIL